MLVLARRVELVTPLYTSHDASVAFDGPDLFASSPTAPFDIELDLLALFEVAVALALDRRVVDHPETATTSELLAA
jgi:hypothetical protein